MSSRRGRAKRTGPSVGKVARGGAAAPSLGDAPPSSVAASLLSGRALWITLGLIAITLVVYYPVAGYGFVTWDDPQYVSENTWVLGGLSWQSFLWAFTFGKAGLWIPVTWLSFMLDVQLFGQGAGGHHLINLLLHIANTLLLFALLRRMTGDLWRSAFVAALFAVHPLHVESVAWVTERKDVLSTFFGLLALWAWVDYAKRPRKGPYLWTVALFALSLMAKAMLVTLPFILLLLDFWPLRRASAGAPPRKAPRGSRVRAWGAVVAHLVREKIPFLAIALASSVVTFVAQRHIGAVMDLESVPSGSRIANALVSYTAYIFQMLWPARLAGLYPIRQLPASWVLGSVALLVGISALALLAARRRPYLPVGWFWFLGTLVPVIGLVQVGVQARADRFTYVPLIGLFIVVAWGVPDLLARWRHRVPAVIAASVLVIAACTGVARVQVRTWKDSLTFWQHTVAVTSGNGRAHANLGYVLMGLGRDREALAQYEEAARLEPRLPKDFYNNFANTLAKEGRIKEAVTEYTEALRLDPDYVAAHNGIGSALDDLGRFDEAISHYESALRIEPGSAMVQSNLAATLAKEGRLAEALAHILAAVSSEPKNANYQFNAALILQRLGRASEAVPHLRIVLELDPGRTDARVLLDSVLAEPQEEGMPHRPADSGEGGR